MSELIDEDGVRFTYATELEDGVIEEKVYLRMPHPGERCALCNRRRNKKRTTEEPTTRRISFVLPVDRAEPVEEGLDALQEVCAVDGASYPRGTLLELLIVLGAQHREEIKAHMLGE